MNQKEMRYQLRVKHPSATFLFIHWTCLTLNFIPRRTGMVGAEIPRGGDGATIPNATLSPPEWFCLIRMGSDESPFKFHGGRGRGQSQKTVSTKHKFWRKRRVKARNWTSTLHLPASYLTTRPNWLTTPSAPPLSLFMCVCVLGGGGDGREKLWMGGSVGGEGGIVGGGGVGKEEGWPCRETIHHSMCWKCAQICDCVKPFCADRWRKQSLKKY